MDKNDSQSKQLREKIYQRLRDGGDLNFVLENNALLFAYLRQSDVATTRFMLANPEKLPWSACQFDPEQTEFATSDLRARHNWLAKLEAEAIWSGTVPTEHTLYSPITPTYIKNLIQIDAVLRLSKAYHRLPRNIFRGTVPAKDTDLRMLNSWSTSVDVARMFRTDFGHVLAATIPAGFPYIDVDKTHCSGYPENEILLPPCEFEINSTDTSAPLEATLRPLCLAKVFLDRMNNLPADYPECYRTHPLYAFDTAKKMLEDYVREYVEKGLIPIGGYVVKEKPDPAITFKFDEPKQ